ncbi:MAG: lipopolysaccharide biosynthesis protein RfbH [Candidatus Melainabacteria bacterium]|nr:lipopolysaccharide biosynthesis protein RfbH [Candidatus Melainabacteria bacterium]
MDKNDLRLKILALVRDFHAQEWPDKKFEPGETYIPYAARVFDEAELTNLVDASLDFWLTTGRYAADFEKEFARYLGNRYAMLCNSGSSANLLALSALTSPRLEDRQLVEGDEVITVAAGFPTTLNPIIQNRFVPVFVDIDLGTYAANVDELEAAVGPKTKAIMLAHTLGNPFDLDAVMRIAQKNNLWLIEDNCDSLGSMYKGRRTGSFGDISTASFYPAHHITMGEGGCVSVNDANLKIIIESFRDWGRDCYCAPGKDNTCGKRFDWQLGSLPQGYDHKYIFSHIGYNLKLTDMQAAVGLAQLAKLPQFVETRKYNWQYLRDGLKQFEEHIIFPEAMKNSEPSWFGFVITTRSGSPLKRSEFVNFLESKNIATRHIFGGNLIRQPAYQNIEKRVASTLSKSDYVMNNSFVMGVYPGIDQSRLDYMIETCERYFRSI